LQCYWFCAEPYKLQRTLYSLGSDGRRLKILYQHQWVWNLSFNFLDKLHCLVWVANVSYPVDAFTRPYRLKKRRRQAWWALQKQCNWT
jgi:hypothetical protein